MDYDSGDKTILGPSYLHNVIFYSNKMKCYIGILLSKTVDNMYTRK